MVVLFAKGTRLSNLKIGFSIVGDIFSELTAITALTTITILTILMYTETLNPGFQTFPSDASTSANKTALFIYM